MNDFVTLQHDYDPLWAMLQEQAARQSLREFRTHCQKLLADQLDFAELCAEYGVDPKAPDAEKQLESNISEKISKLGASFESTNDRLRDYVFKTDDGKEVVVKLT